MVGWWDGGMVGRWIRLFSIVEDNKGAFLYRQGFLNRHRQGLEYEFCDLLHSDWGSMDCLAVLSSLYQNATVENGYCRVLLFLSAFVDWNVFISKNGVYCIQ